MLWQVPSCPRFTQAPRFLCLCPTWRLLSCSSSSVVRLGPVSVTLTCTSQEQGRCLNEGKQGTNPPPGKSTTVWRSHCSPPPSTMIQPDCLIAHTRTAQSPQVQKFRSARSWTHTTQAAPLSFNQGVLHCYCNPKLSALQFLHKLVLQRQFPHNQVPQGRQLTAR